MRLAETTIGGHVRRVLMTADAVGGVWSYTLDLARALPEVEFTCAVLGPAPERGQVEEAAEIPNLRLEAVGGRLEWMDDPWDDVEIAAVPLLALAEEVRPDVVHLNDYSSGALPWNAPVLMAGHSCVCSWWEAVKGEPAPGRCAEYRERVRAGLAAAEAVAAPSRWMLAELERLHGAPAGGAVVYNGVSAPGGEREYGGALRRPVVLAAGRLWDEAKNLRLLLGEAAALDAEVRIAGEVRGGLDLPGNVTSLGRLSRGAMAAAMREADIFVHPARYEPFGLAALEAASAGCALVLGDIPPLREVWGDAALYVEPSDGYGLRCAVERLGDCGERARWARAARERSRRYTLERFGAGYRELYERLAGAPIRVRRASELGEGVR